MKLGSKDTAKNYILLALGSNQLLEESIKFYIEIAYKKIKLNLPKDVTFNFEVKDHEKDSMGRLLNTFAKLNNNRNLQKELAAFVNKRNFIAHKVFSNFETISSTKPRDLKAFEDKIQRIFEEGQDLVEKMALEHKKLNMA